MTPWIRNALPRMVVAAAALLIVKVALGVLTVYGEYFPPDFSRGFLMGRKESFPGSYAVAFYVHIVAGPPSLLIGVLLMSGGFRRRWPGGHRRLGRVQSVLVLTGVAPAGLRMEMDAEDGPIAAAGFATLAVATAATLLLGWRAAVRRDLPAHEVWMGRCFALLCSAVVVRLWGGMTEVLELEGRWPYLAASWAGWLLPLLVWEIVWRQRCRDFRQAGRPCRSSGDPTSRASMTLERTCA